MRIHVVQDSDELFLSSWGPLAEQAISKTRFPFERYLAGHFFRQSFYSGFFDPLKRKLFFLPVRWHSKPLNEKWNVVEQAAMRELLLWVAPVDQKSSAATAHTAALGRKIKSLPLSALRITAYMWIFRRRIAHISWPRHSRRPRNHCAHRLVCTHIHVRDKSAIFIDRKMTPGASAEPRFGIAHKNEKRSESSGVSDIPGHKTTGLHGHAKIIKEIGDPIDLKIFVHIDKSAILPHKLLQEVETGFI